MTHQLTKRTVWGRTFDYVPRLVEANLQHLVSALQPFDYGLWQTSRWWTGGPVLDQGREGACVGFGCTGEWLASPVRGRLSPFADRVEKGNETALTVYRRAKEIDEWEGVDYDGTSVRAGMLVGRELGWWKSFRWAKNIQDLRLALEHGPVVIGVTWLDGMYSTDPSGFVKTTGGIVGGHCLVITGYSPDYRGRGPHFRWRNSWSASYGMHGNGYISPQDLDAILFQAGNEAAVPLERSLA